MNGHEIVLSYLEIILSPQVVIGGVIVVFLLLIFRVALTALIDRVASIKWGQHGSVNYLVNVPEKIDSEEMTDLAAIFLGFGSTILRGYELFSAISCRLGYIDLSTIRRAIMQVYSLRNWSFKDIIHEFKWFESHKYFFQFNLLPRSVFRALFSSKSSIEPAQKTNGKRVIPCNSCGQKLRVSNSPISLKVKCPKCGSSFVIGNDGRII